MSSFSTTINECWRFSIERWYNNWWFKYRKRLCKNKHQHGAQVNDKNQNIKVYFGDNINYIQIGNSYLETEIIVKKADRTNFTDADENRLVYNAFAYVFQDARISAWNGTQIEQNKNVGPISTITRWLTHEDGDLSTYLDKIDETRAGIVNISLKHFLIINHELNSNTGEIKGHAPLEHNVQKK